MPAATTHYLFSKDAYALMSENIKEKITNLKMYYLGSQGPDVFFFHKAGLIKNSLNHVGGYLHRIKVFEVIRYFFDYAKEDNDLLSYIYGYLCHYALDSNAHPLVIYGSLYLNNPKETETENHYRIEAYIDTYMLNKLGLSKKDYIVDKEIKIDEPSKNKLAAMYKGLLKNIFNEEASIEDLKQSFEDESRFLSIMKPNSKMKFYAIRGIEKLFFKGKAIVTGMMLYNENLNRADEILNFERKEYFNTDDKTIRYSTSFDDCYRNALDTFVKIISNPADPDLFKLDFEGNKHE